MIGKSEKYYTPSSNKAKREKNIITIERLNEKIWFYHLTSQIPSVSLA